MTNQTATKRPWRYTQERPYSGCVIVGNDINGYICTTSGNAVADAKLIVHCVNQHDKLVEALKLIKRRATDSLGLMPFSKQATLKDIIINAEQALSAESEN